MLDNTNSLHTIKHPHIKEGVIIQPQPYREFHFHEDMVVMIIVQHGVKKEIIIDREDYERVSRHTWSINSYRQEEGYAYSQTAGYLHRFIMKMNKGDGMIVDHINRNHLDCRKSNLRVCTNSENCKNKDYTNTKNESGYAGVVRTNGKWRASITVNGDFIHLGYFDDVDEAIKYRKCAEVEYWKEYAPMSSQEVVV